MRSTPGAHARSRRSATPLRPAVAQPSGAGRHGDARRCVATTDGGSRGERGRDRPCPRGVVAAGDDESSLHEPPGLVPAAVLAHLALARGHVLTPDALADRVWDELPTTRAMRCRRPSPGCASRSRRRSWRARTRATGSMSTGSPSTSSRPNGSSRTRARPAAPVTSVRRPSSPERLSSALPWGSAGRTAVAASTRRASTPTSCGCGSWDLRSEGLLATGQAAAAATVLRSTRTAAPLAEPVHGLLMRALVADGRPNDALAVYDGLRRRLADAARRRPVARGVRHLRRRSRGRARRHRRRQRPQRWPRARGSPARCRHRTRSAC